MKRLFFYLLRRYSWTEKQRMEIYSRLWESVTDEYNEQSGFGNVHNMNIEFLMANPVIISLVEKKDKKGISVIKRILNESFEEAIGFVEKERFKRTSRKRKEKSETPTISGRIQKIS